MTVVIKTEFTECYFEFTFLLGAVSFPWNESSVNIVGGLFFEFSAPTSGLESASDIETLYSRGKVRSAVYI
jgi:hypothetical protein